MLITMELYGLGIVVDFEGNMRRGGLSIRSMQQYMLPVKRTLRGSIRSSAGRMSHSSSKNLAES
jgi:hypothetical protein